MRLQFSFSRLLKIHQLALILPNSYGNFKSHFKFYSLFRLWLYFCSFFIYHEITKTKKEGLLWRLIFIFTPPFPGILMPPMEQMIQEGLKKGLSDHVLHGTYGYGLYRRNRDVFEVVYRSYHEKFLQMKEKYQDQIETSFRHRAGLTASSG